MITLPSCSRPTTRLRRTGVRRDMLSLLAGLALGVAAVFAIQPAHADVIDGHAAAIVTHLTIRSE